MIIHIVKLSTLILSSACTYSWTHAGIFRDCEIRQLWQGRSFPFSPNFVSFLLVRLSSEFFFISTHAATTVRTLSTPYYQSKIVKRGSSPCKHIRKHLVLRALSASHTLIFSLPCLIICRTTRVQTRALDYRAKSRQARMHVESDPTTIAHGQQFETMTSSLRTRWPDRVAEQWLQTFPNQALSSRCKTEASKMELLEEAA